MVAKHQFGARGLSRANGVRINLCDFGLRAGDPRGLLGCVTPKPRSASAQSDFELAHVFHHAEYAGALAAAAAAAGELNVKERPSRAASQLLRCTYCMRRRTTSNFCEKRLSGFFFAPDLPQKRGSSRSTALRLGDPSDKHQVPVTTA